MGIYDPDFSMSANMGICSLEDERMKMDNHILVVEDVIKSLCPLLSN